MTATVELDRTQYSVAEQIALRAAGDRERLMRELAPDDESAAALEYDWSFWGRPKQQIPPGWWFVWLVMSGRGFGKTRIGSETIQQWAKDNSPMAIVGSTAADVRDIQIVGKDTGASILECAAPWFRPVYEPSKRLLTWPNGAIAHVYGADEPETFRGPQHRKAWLDEIAKWRYLDAAMDNITFGMRLGDHPQMVITTTPKPRKRLIQLARSKRTRTTTGSMFENARNLAPVFLEEILERYGGTRQGLQEIYGRLLQDIEGALFPRARIDAGRVRRAPTDLARVAIAIDPAAGSGPDSNDTGIVAAASDTRKPAHFYVLADRTCHLPPAGWAATAVNLYHELSADVIVAEVNNGGEMVAATIRNTPGAENVKVKVVHATRGKIVRAEPISLLYEQGRVHHVSPLRRIVRPDNPDELAALEDQMTLFDDTQTDQARRKQDAEGSSSPDRVDALVWALTHLSERRVGGVAA